MNPQDTIVRLSREVEGLKNENKTLTDDNKALMKKLAHADRLLERWVRASFPVDKPTPINLHTIKPDHA